MKGHKGRKDERRAQTLARQQLARLQTPQERLRVLDKRLGTNVGAVKERAKLAKRIKG